MFGVIILGYFVLMISTSNNKDVTPVSDQQVEQAILHSDDFIQYRTTFISSAQKLLQAGRCSLVELEESDGWSKSINFKSEPVYFIECGGLRTRKIYINALTGEIY